MKKLILVLLTLSLISCAKNDAKSNAGKEPAASSAGFDGANCNMVFIKSYKSIHEVDAATSTATIKKVAKKSDATHSDGYFFEFKGKRYAPSDKSDQADRHLENTVGFEIDTVKLTLTNENNVTSSLTLLSNSTSSLLYSQNLTTEGKKQRYDTELKNSGLAEAAKEGKIINKICGPKKIEVFHDLDVVKNTLKITSETGIEITGNASSFEKAIFDGEFVEVKLYPSRTTDPVVLPLPGGPGGDPTLPTLPGGPGGDSALPTLQ